MKNIISNLMIMHIMVALAFLHGYALAQDTSLVSLDDLIQEAEQNNPKIQKAYHNWKAEEYKIKHVKSLPDPMATYGYFGESVQTRVGPQEQKVGVSQKIPFPGKLHLKGKAQEKQAEMAKERYEAEKFEVIKKLRFIYYDIYWVDKALEVIEEEKNILENLEKVARRKYEANLTHQQDVIKAQVELSKLINKLYLLNQNRDSLEAQMNSVLNRPERSNLGTILDIDTIVFSYDLSTLSEMVTETRQELLEANLTVEKARHEKSLARLNYFPDFTFGAEFIEIGGGTTTRPDDGQDAWMGMVSVNLPIWYGNLKSQLNEKKARLEAANKNYENLENTVLYEVQDEYFKITTYRDIITLYETAIVPQAEQAFDAARLGYESGHVDFLNWLDAQRTFLQTRLAYYKAVVDYHKSIAHLERVIGKKL